MNMLVDQQASFLENIQTLTQTITQSNNATRKRAQPRAAAVQGDIDDPNAMDVDVDAADAEGEDGDDESEPLPVVSPGRKKRWKLTSLPKRRTQEENALKVLIPRYIPLSSHN